MTKDEALKLALEALISCELSNYGRDWVWLVTAHEQAMKGVKEAITAIKEALAQSKQESTNWHVIDPTGNVVATEKDAIHGWARLGGFKPTLEVLLAHHESGWRVVPAPPLPVQPVERNFCPRCGKRTADLTTIHTCTPPQTIADEHIAKVTSGIDLAVNKALAHPQQEAIYGMNPDDWKDLTDAVKKVRDGRGMYLACQPADVFQDWFLWLGTAKIKERT